MNTFANTLLNTLREMDTEASTTFKGSPTGLNFYGGYYRPTLQRPPTETSWTRRLKEMLTIAGYPTKAEVYYPGSKLRCDNVVTMPDGGLLWLENKGAWKQYWIRSSCWSWFKLLSCAGPASVTLVKAKFSPWSWLNPLTYTSPASVTLQDTWLEAGRMSFSSRGIARVRSGLPTRQWRKASWRRV